MSNQELNLSGIFSIEHWRDGKCINTYLTPNSILYFAKINMLEKIFFPSTIGEMNWYIGFIDAKTWIMGTNPDANFPTEMFEWTEWTDYGFNDVKFPTTRIQWQPDPATVGFIENTTLKAEITALNDAEVKGFFLVNDPNFGFHNQDAIFWATSIIEDVLADSDSPLPNSLPLYKNDLLKVTYKVTFTNDSTYVSDQGLGG
jgi:hypothetical protein